MAFDPYDLNPYIDPEELEWKKKKKEKKEQMELLRDTIAIAAMQGILASEVPDSVECFAKSSYDMAEAMLKERAKRLEKDNEA